MLKTILTIGGRPGLFKLVNHGKNSIIVESMADNKRFPVYGRDKVMSLGDIAIYTESEERPLGEVFEIIKEKNDSKPVDIKKLGDDSAIRKYFGEILPDFDRERVYTNDIKKLFNWYNLLINAGVTDFVEKETDDKKEEETTQE